MDKKTFLLKSLQLSKAMLTSDEKAVEISKEFKSLDSDEKNQLNDTVNTFIDKCKKPELLKQVIQNLDIDSKEYLLAIMELRTLDLINKREESLKIIREKLNSTTIKFSNDNEKFNYYSLLVNLTITSGDESLIEVAITKIQEI